jgi:hypothetical protein
MRYNSIEKEYTMKKMMAILAAAAMSIGVAAGAHEGHDHDMPSGKKALKGGILKSLEKTNVEVVSRQKNLKIYLYDQDMKPQAISGYQVTAKSENPRTKKLEDVLLTAGESFYEANYDAKGMHRYTLHVAIRDPKTGHDDKIKFTIEPRK